MHYDQWLRSGSRPAIEKALADEDCLADLFDMGSGLDRPGRVRRSSAAPVAASAAAAPG